MGSASEEETPQLTIVSIFIESDDIELNPFSYEKLVNTINTILKYY
jgi:hypothetical protein